MSDLIFFTFLHSLQIALFALALDWSFGYPPLLQKFIGHPVEWIGHLIDFLDRKMNVPCPQRGGYLRGIVALILLLLLVVIPTLAGSVWLQSRSGGWIIESFLAAWFLAQRSLDDHVRAVHHGLSENLLSGRECVAKIVGRDTSVLDESGVSKAAIESLAESSSDGVIAPLFFLLLGGLPGIIFYKLVNTGDSMIGHKTPRYLTFGWACARLDDLLNWIPSRLTGCLFLLAALFTEGSSVKGALSALWQDARHHDSPNAGYPEAAMAGALGIRLGGARCYDGDWVDLPSMGKGAAPLARDIVRALGLYMTLLRFVWTTLGVCFLIMLFFQFGR